jgi:hypothetical protein
MIRQAIRYAAPNAAKRADERQREATASGGDGTWDDDLV